MVYLFVLAVGFLAGVFATCLLLAFWERDTRRAGDVLDLTGTRPRNYTRTAEPDVRFNDRIGT